MRRIIYLTLFLLVFIFTGGLNPVISMADSSQQTQILSKPLTLTEAIGIAVKNNPEIKAAHFQMEAADSDTLQARSGFFPQANFTENFNRTNNPMWTFGTKLNQGNIKREEFDPAILNGPDAISNFASVFSLSWMLYDGGKTRSFWKQAKENEKVSALMFERVRQNVIARTAQAYVELLFAEKNIRVIDESIRSAMANLQMVTSRYKNGFIVKSDLLRAKVRIAELKERRLQAKNAIKVANSSLISSMGYSVSGSVNPVTALTVEKEIKRTVDEWLNTALLTRPDFKLIQHQEKMAKIQIDKSRAGHFPQLDLVGNYQVNSENFSETSDNYSIGAVMRMNLFSGYRITEKTKASRYLLNRIQEMKKSLELGIRNRTRESFLNVETARERINVTQTAIGQAEEGLKIVKNRYRNGLVTIVSLLDAEVAKQKAHIGYLKAIHDYKMARIELGLAAGTINDNFH